MSADRVDSRTHGILDGRSHLPPHVWDDAAHRAAIHAMCDRVWIAAASRAGYPLARARYELRRLVADAAIRQAARGIS